MKIVNDDKVMAETKMMMINSPHSLLQPSTNSILVQSTIIISNFLLYYTCKYKTCKTHNINAQHIVSYTCFVRHESEREMMFRLSK